MPRRIGQRGVLRSFSFRMPADVFGDLAAVARARGIDVSTLVNCVLADYRPYLLKQKAEHEAALMDAAEAAIRSGGGPDARGRLGTVRDLIGRLQELHAGLAETPPQGAGRLAS